MNASQERQHLHWPCLVKSDSGAYDLKCQKRGQSTTHHKKHVFLKAKCGKAAEQAVLCDDPAQEDVRIPETPGCRGGLQMRIGTLNIGGVRW